ncbi:MAG: formylglycine-generating enzyme family protein [Verrucomicrobia bacterium]|nr:formylglycine-generating enzyme family protein [Verrucomicrobiota bacterium]
MKSRRNQFEVLPWIVVCVLVASWTVQPVSAGMDEVALQTCEKKCSQNCAQSDGEQNKQSGGQSAVIQPENNSNWVIPNLNLKLIWIAPGSFQMGSPAGEAGKQSDETQHEVRLTRGFWLGETEVTQRQWHAVMGTKPSQFKGYGDLPVESVSWEECLRFCQKLTQSERMAGRLSASMEYTLPTEAQWEFACRERGNATGPFHHGASLLSTQANISGNGTKNVRTFPPNALGLYDLHGNVWEWCQDIHGAYPSDSVTDPVGSQGSFRVFRGGSWASFAQNCRSARRNGHSPSDIYNYLGFRLALQHSLGIQ